MDARNQINQQSTFKCKTTLTVKGTKRFFLLFSFCKLKIRLTFIFALSFLFTTSSFLFYCSFFYLFNKIMKFTSFSFRVWFWLYLVIICPMNFIILLLLLFLYADFQILHYISKGYFLFIL